MTTVFTGVAEMSRIGQETIAIKPQNDIYTALLAVALVTLIIGLIILFVRAASLFPEPLWAG
ncbi:MAG: hypothetical protein ACK4PI_00950 [Tepidisphaerales bacterium]